MPIPTLPFAKTVRSVVVELPAVVEAMERSGVLTAVLAELEMEEEVGRSTRVPFEVRRLQHLSNCADRQHMDLPLPVIFGSGGLEQDLVSGESCLS